MSKILSLKHCNFRQT